MSLETKTSGFFQDSSRADAHREGGSDVVSEGTGHCPFRGPAGDTESRRTCCAVPAEGSCCRSQAQRSRTNIN